MTSVPKGIVDLFGSKGDADAYWRRIERAVDDRRCVLFAGALEGGATAGPHDSHLERKLDQILRELEELRRRLPSDASGSKDR